MTYARSYQQGVKAYLDSVDSLKAVISQALFFDRRSHRKDEPESNSALV